MDHYCQLLRPCFEIDARDFLIQNKCFSLLHADKNKNNFKKKRLNSFTKVSHNLQMQTENATLNDPHLSEFEAQKFLNTNKCISQFRNLSKATLDSEKKVKILLKNFTRTITTRKTQLPKSTTTFLTNTET